MLSLRIHNLNYFACLLACGDNIVAKAAALLMNAAVLLGVQRRLYPSEVQAYQWHTEELVLGGVFLIKNKTRTENKHYTY